MDSIQIFADNDPSTDYDGIIGQRLLERFSKVGIFPDSKIVIFCEKGEPLKITDGIVQPLVKSGGVLMKNSATCGATTAKSRRLSAVSSNAIASLSRTTRFTPGRTFAPAPFSPRLNAASRFATTPSCRDWRYNIQSIT